MVKINAVEPEIKLFSPHSLFSVLYRSTPMCCMLMIYCTLFRSAPPLSLWGEAADFTFWCHWRLKPEVSIPALQELTVCFDLKFKVLMNNVLLGTAQLIPKSYTAVQDFMNHIYFINHI